jgi:A/G-specific adenine glycosylase
MLQQTQVTRVISKYREFIKAYPAASDLAKAPTTDVLRIWKGMGYNRRALYLKKAAAAGEFPKNEKELMKLPGVGTYTARAILVFAYKHDVAMVDTNIRQTITHFFFNDTPQKEKEIENVADQLLPKGKSWEWHQALMDYGSLEMSSKGRSASGRKKIKSSVPFKNSNRYYRGKLMDVLREGRRKEKSLQKDFSQSVIDGLLKDGLIVRSHGIISLPD